LNIPFPSNPMSGRNRSRLAGNPAASSDLSTAEMQAMMAEAGGSPHGGQPHGGQPHGGHAPAVAPTAGAWTPSQPIPPTGHQTPIDSPVMVPQTDPATTAGYAAQGAAPFTDPTPTPAPGSAPNTWQSAWQPAYDLYGRAGAMGNGDLSHPPVSKALINGIENDPSIQLARVGPDFSGGRREANPTLAAERKVPTRAGISSYAMKLLHPAVAATMEQVETAANNRQMFDELGRYKGGYDLLGRPVDTLWNLPLGGHVRAMAENTGADEGMAKGVERALAGLLATGVGVPAFMAAYNGLSGATSAAAADAA